MKNEDTVRYDKNGKLVWMASAKGYVMVRHPGCAPFVISEKQWLALPLAPHDQA